MLKKILSAALLLAIPLAMTGAAKPRPAPQPPHALERVVMVMRHGIRPPTSAAPAPAGYTGETWPSWPVDYGLLTPRGAQGATLLGAADRALYQARGLFNRGCPASGSIVVKASGKSRTQKTAEAWQAGFAPSCTPVAIEHPGAKDPDPIFHGLDDQPASFDGQRAYAQALALAPKGGVALESRTYRPQLELLAKALGCAAPTCPVLTEPTRLVAMPHDRPELVGPLDEGSSISQSFLLEYLEGMPMQDVAWGRATRAEIERMLALHPLKFKYSNRPDYVARAAAAPLAREIVAALTRPGGARLTLLAGHDTNIADLGGFFRLHWAVPSYPADDVPPGSALGFELLKSAKGVRYVRAFYRAQTMDQLRELRPLTGTEAPYRQYLPILGCGNSIMPSACSLEAFRALVSQRAG
ncbi:MAG: histidine-type phosphatase [Sphingomonadales bacterium]|nr:histidine-type phosphatase [Sphingomonadales bacterium]